MEYTIVSSISPTILIEKVNEKIKEGWNIVGAMTPIINYGGVLTFYQTMFLFCPMSDEVFPAEPPK